MDPIFASYLQIPTNVLLTNSLYLDIYISFRKQKNEKKKQKKSRIVRKKYIPVKTNLYLSNLWMLYFYFLDVLYALTHMFRSDL